MIFPRTRNKISQTEKGPFASSPLALKIDLQQYIPHEIVDLKGPKLIQKVSRERSMLLFAVI
jgi:hypothetical protein